MSLSEFDIITKYFASLGPRRDDVLVGINDDCALVTIPKAHKLAVTTDTLVAGVHFPKTTSAQDIGYKAMAVNLSDLAAMGARPAWVTLALTLPEVDEKWLQSFTIGMYDLLQEYHVQLVGGDISKGPELVITIQAHGFVTKTKSMLRSGAKVGDLIYVTETLGDAALALQALQGKRQIEPGDLQALTLKLNRPQPRIVPGLAIRELATSCIDISDGLSADLGHILEQSQRGAEIYVTELPFSKYYAKYCGDDYHLALQGGDDYELCFTVPPRLKEKLHAIAKKEAFKVTCIGRITDELGLSIYDKDKNLIMVDDKGYRHF